MTTKKILGFDIFLLALILVLCVSYNSGQQFDNEDGLLDLLTGNSKNDEIIKLNTGDGDSRDKRGIKLKMPRPPKNPAPKPSAPKPSAPKLPEGHTRHVAPKTEDIAIDGLTKQKSKSSVQGGGGMRDRWTDEKNRKTYEWDSRHGELEVYRNSDKKHTGTIDPKTGDKIKDAIPGRKLKD